MQRFAAIGIAAMALVVLALPASAAGAYATGSTGFDISYPQCGAAVPGGSFGLIGVTGGRAFSQNSCFGPEYDQASAATGGAVSIYMNLNAAIGSTASNGLTSPAGTCKRGDKSCMAYNYGWNAASAAYSYAGSRTAANWWLDIETANSWNADTSLNRRTIQGAAEYLTNVRGRQVGIYSNASMWSSITGGWQNVLPVWYAGNNGSTCSSVSSFTNGPLDLLQNASGQSNGDIGC